MPKTPAEIIRELEKELNRLRNGGADYKYEWENVFANLKLLREAVGNIPQEEPVYG